jgi:hypothetical protein
MIHTNPRARDLLERIEARERESARILRAHGREREALRAERFARRIRLRLDEPAAVRRMYALARDLHRATHHRVLLERALEGAMSLLGASFGNLQLRDPVSGVLTIAVAAGFGSEFLEYFATVKDESSACGRAAGRASQALIVDVSTDPGFAAHRAIAAATGFRAVQSTPLVDDTGRVRGVISTHFGHPHRPAMRDLDLMAWYGELIGVALAGQQQRPVLLFAAAADYHAQSADRQDAAASLMLRRADALRGADAPRAAELRAWAHLAQGRAVGQRERSEGQRRLAAAISPAAVAPSIAGD